MTSRITKLPQGTTRRGCFEPPRLGLIHVRSKVADMCGSVADSQCRRTAKYTDAVLCVHMIHPKFRRAQLELRDRFVRFTHVQPHGFLRSKGADVYSSMILYVCSRESYQVCLIRASFLFGIIWFISRLVRTLPTTNEAVFRQRAR